MNVYWKRALKAICVDYIFFVENKQLFEMTRNRLHLWLLTLISVIYQNSSKTPLAGHYFFSKSRTRLGLVWDLSSFVKTIRNYLAVTRGVQKLTLSLKNSGVGYKKSQFSSSHIVVFSSKVILKQKQHWSNIFRIKYLS